MVCDWICLSCVRDLYSAHFRNLVSISIIGIFIVQVDSAAVTSSIFQNISPAHNVSDMWRQHYVKGY